MRTITLMIDHFDANAGIRYNAGDVIEVEDDVYEQLIRSYTALRKKQVEQQGIQPLKESSDE